MNAIQEFIGHHPVIFSIIVIIAFIGYVRSLIAYMKKRSKK